MKMNRNFQWCLLLIFAIARKYLLIGLHFIYLFMAFDSVVLVIFTYILHFITYHFYILCCKII